MLRMATENHWRAWKIQAELSKLGIEVSLATISRHLPEPKPDPGSRQRWITFLRNHRDVIAGMDFFVVPTVRFHLLYVWFAIDHARRRVLHFNVTANPAARWVIQQLRNAFPDAPSHRFSIFDNDAIFSAEVACSIGRFGIHPRRTAFRSPWQNGTAERFVGSVRRELLDHVVVLGETTYGDCSGITSRTTTRSASTLRSGMLPRAESPRSGLRATPGSSAHLGSEVATIGMRGVKQPERVGIS
jgi:transposase InsO family protein